MFVEVFYDSDRNLKKWRWYNMFTINGTSLLIPDIPKNIEYFGCKKN